MFFIFGMFFVWVLEKIGNAVAGKKEQFIDFNK